MDFIKQWTLAIAVSAIVGGIVLILSPDGSTQKAVQTAVSVVILCVLLSPFTSGIKPDIPQSIDISEPSDIKENTVEMFKEAVSRKINNILKQNGVNNSQISIDITTDANNEMKINSVKIITDGGDTESAKNQIRQELGAEVEIEVEQ